MKRVLKVKEVYWYWITLVLVLMTILSVFIIHDQSIFSFIRVGLGFVFVVFMPGYSLMRVLFPNKFENLGKTRGIDQLTRYSLAIVLSIGVVSMVGLILDYTPLGINLETLVFSLSALTAFFANIALLREFQNFNRQKGNSESNN